MSTVVIVARSTVVESAVVFVGFVVGTLSYTPRQTSRGTEVLKKFTSLIYTVIAVLLNEPAAISKFCTLEWII